MAHDSSDTQSINQSMLHARPLHVVLPLSIITFFLSPPPPTTGRNSNHPPPKPSTPARTGGTPHSTFTYNCVMFADTGLLLCMTLSSRRYFLRSAEMKVKVVTTKTAKAAMKRPADSSEAFTSPLPETELNWTPSDEMKLSTSDVDAMSAT